MVTALQIRMARAALGWTVDRLARRAKLDPGTITRSENSGNIMAATLAQIQRTLEKGGVIFIQVDEHGGEGVRLKKRRPA